MNRTWLGVRWVLWSAAWLLLTGRAVAADGPGAGDVVSEEFTVTAGAKPFVVRLQSPPRQRLAAAPLLLLNFSTDRESSLQGGRYGDAARIFLEAGHRVASFDLPAHGERVRPGVSGLEGLVKLVMAGERPFDRFVEEGRAAVDELVQRRLAEPGRVVVCGVSRAGYCALRLAAAEPRIAAVAGLAPVTEWGAVREFAKVAGADAVRALDLVHVAAGLAGRRVYVAIGNADRRVDQNACTRFILAVGAAETQRGLTESGVRYVLADDSEGHALATRWRREGVQFLLSAGPTSRAAPAPALP